MINRWLIVGPSWVGDMVMAQSLFKALKRAEPECLIDVVAPAWSHPILARMPEVNEAINLDVKHGEWGFRKRLQLGRRLEANRYSRSIVIPRSLKAALVPFFASIPVRTGYRGEMRYGLLNDMRLLDKKRLPLAVERFVALGLPPSVDAPAIINPTLQVDADNQQRLAGELNLTLDRPVAALLPGAEFGPAKQWPEQNWSELAEQLTERGYQVWCLGSPKDQAVADRIQAQTGAPVLNLCGKTRLEDAVDLLALADVAVSNDSGLMHVAAAVDCHVIAIYRTTTPDYTPPLTEKTDIFRADLGGRNELMGVRELPDEHGIRDVGVGEVVEAVCKQD